MLGQAVQEVRKRVKLSQSVFADYIGVSPRTIAAWESSGAESDIPRSPAYMIRSVFQEKVLGDKLTYWTDEAFKRMPSEVVCLWVLEQDRCILLSLAGANRLAAVREPRAEKLQDIRFDEKKRREVIIPNLNIRLDQKGLTTTPLLTTEIIRCAGYHIENHKNKRHENTRAANYFIGGICESLLHIPVFTEGRFGPVPALMLCMQNKLDEHYKVIPGPKDQTVAQEVYTQSDEDEMIRFARGEMKQDLVPDLKLLDMLNIT